MALGLTSRVGLRRAFYAITGTSATDTALTEHDLVAGDQLYYYLTQGAWAAQRYMIDHGWSDWWLKTSPALAFTTGTERYVALPVDFLEFADGGGASALRESDGRAYGFRVPSDDLEWRGRNTYPSGAWNYALRNDRIYVGDGGTIPTGLTLRYYYRHPDFDTDAVLVDFPVEHRPLIVAEAADLAAKDSWLVGGAEMEGRIQRALAAARERAATARRTREPRRFAGRPAFNGSWF